MKKVTKSQLSLAAGKISTSVLLAQSEVCCYSCW